MDLIEFTNRIAFLTKKIDYYISSINGMTLVNSDVSYLLNVTGLGFGLTDSRQSYLTFVYVNNNLLPVTSIDLTQRRQMRLTIPNALIKPMFKNNKIVYIPIKIVSEIRKPGNFFGWGKSSKKYETQFNIVLMPTIAGEVKITETVSQKILDDEILSHTITKSFGKECKTDHPCIMDEPWSCGQNQKIVSVEYSCTGQCQFSYNKRFGGGSADFEISDNATSVRVFRYVDGADNTTVIYTVKYKNYKDQNSVINNKTIQLKYGEPFDVILDAQNPDCNYSILGKLITGQSINYNNNTISNSPDLKLLGIGKTGNVCKASFKLIAQ